MRHAWRVLALAIVLLRATPASAAVPDLAWFSRSIANEPTWVSAEVAVVDGKLQTQYFHPTALAILEDFIEVSRSNVAGCEVYLETAAPLGTFKGNTVAAIRKLASQAISGSITDLREGFLGGQPHTMVEIAVDSESASAGARRVYVFLQLARIDVHGIRLCSGLEMNRAAPHVGASVVLALDSTLGEERILGRTEDGEPLLQVYRNEILIAGALPRDYRGSGLDVDDFRRQLRTERPPR